MCFLFRHVQTPSCLFLGILACLFVFESIHAGQRPLTRTLMNSFNKKLTIFTGEFVFHVIPYGNLYFVSVANPPLEGTQVTIDASDRIAIICQAAAVRGHPKDQVAQNVCMLR
jgi:hypothetical protein